MITYRKDELKILSALAKAELRSNSRLGGCVSQRDAESVSFFYMRAIPPVLAADVGD